MSTTAEQSTYARVKVYRIPFYAMYRAIKKRLVLKQIAQISIFFNLVVDKSQIIAYNLDVNKTTLSDLTEWVNTRSRATVHGRRCFLFFFKLVYIV